MSACERSARHALRPVRAPHLRSGFLCIRLKRTLRGFSSARQGVAMDYKQYLTGFTQSCLGMEAHPRLSPYPQMKVNPVPSETATSGESCRKTMSSNNWLGEEDRGRAAEALHAIRNRLTAIFGFAELAQAGSQRAQQRLLDEITNRTDAICSQLDVIDAAVRCTHRFGASSLKAD